MKFETTILDRHGAEWDLTCEVIGKGMYDDDGNKSGLVVEGFDIVDLTISSKEYKVAAVFKVENYKVMPDTFNEREVRILKQDATEAFLNDWMNIQECAHDAFISQKLS